MAVVCVAVALLLRWLVGPWLGPTVPYLSFFPAVLIASWFGGFGPGLLAAGLSPPCSYVWFLLPVGLLKIPAAYDLRSIALFMIIGAGIAYLAGAMKKAEASERRAAGEWRTTLASIGDGVIVTDTEGRVRFLNAVAERLTGWTTIEARERPLDEVFVIANETPSSRSRTRSRRVLREGTPIGLANHTILKHRQGRWRPIADSGAPVRNDEGEIDGVVLVFRDQTAERDAGRQLRRSQRPAAGDQRQIADGDLRQGPRGPLSVRQPELPGSLPHHAARRSSGEPTSIASAPRSPSASARWTAASSRPTGRSPRRSWCRSTAASARICR